MTIHDRIGRYLQAGRGWNTRNVGNIQVLTVHHDTIPHSNQSVDAILRNIYNTHAGKNGWPGISYHYYIHWDGSIYQINKHEWVTWHDTRNYDSLGILLSGYFHPPYNNVPTEKQKQSLRWLLTKLGTQHPEFPASPSDVYGHRERSQTACPGERAITFVVDFRNKNGNVDWGQLVEPTPPTPEPPTPTIPVQAYVRFPQPKAYVINKDTKLWNFNANGWNFTAVKDMRKGEKFEAVGYAQHSNGGKYYMTAYSFAEADKTHTPKATNGVNEVDLSEVTAPPPAPTPVPANKLEGIKQVIKGLTNEDGNAVELDKYKDKPFNEIVHDIIVNDRRFYDFRVKPLIDARDKQWQDALDKLSL